MSRNRRRFGVRFGGASSSQQDTRMKISYFNFFGISNPTSYSNIFNGWAGGKVPQYSDIFSTYYLSPATEFSSPVINNFTEDKTYDVYAVYGLTIAGYNSKDKYSIYKREYQVFLKPGPKIFGYYYKNDFYEDSAHTKKITPREGYIYVDYARSANVDRNYYYVYKKSNNSYIMTEKARIYQGEWEPVVLDTTLSSGYDFNICNNKTYQYILFIDQTVPVNVTEEETVATQIFANSTDQYSVWYPDPSFRGQGYVAPGGEDVAADIGAGISPKWEDWSICELVPQESDGEHKIYKVDSSQVWRFKFSLETGSEKQNIARTDYQTLGKFPKIGYGTGDYDSGDVSALMGSEIVYGSNAQYVERMNSSRLSPLSSNEKAKMLSEWKAFVASSNPKLLKDIKGKSWIVQIMSSENSVKNFYRDTPDTISFQWKQIEDTKDVMIYATSKNQAQETQATGETPYEPLF